MKSDNVSSNAKLLINLIDYKYLINCQKNAKSI